VNHGVIAIPLEAYVRESLLQPHVERILQEQVG